MPAISLAGGSGHVRKLSTSRRLLLAFPGLICLSRSPPSSAGWLQQTDNFTKAFKEALEAKDFEVEHSFLCQAFAVQGLALNPAVMSYAGSRSSLEQGNSAETRECGSVEQSWNSKAPGWKVPASHGCDQGPGPTLLMAGA